MLLGGNSVGAHMSTSPSPQPRLTDEIEALEDAGDNETAAKLTETRRGELVKKMRSGGLGWVCMAACCASVGG